MMLSEDLQRLNLQMARHGSVASDHYQYILYELISILNDPNEDPSQRPGSRFSRQRLSSYQSIGDNHYELIPVMHDSYEAPLQKCTSAPGTEYQIIAPHGMHKGDCHCKHCIDQTNRDSLNTLSEVEESHSTAPLLESVQETATAKQFPDGAASEFQMPHSIPNSLTDDALQGSNRCEQLLRGPSQSLLRHLSRRRKLGARMARIKDYTDDDFDGDWMQLEKIKEKEQEIEDDNFISKLLSDVRKEPITDILPGFSPFTIPKILPKFKQEKEKELSPNSGFSFLEIQEEKDEDPEQPFSETEQFADDLSMKVVKQALDHQAPIIDTDIIEDDSLVTAVTRFCVAEVQLDDKDIENDNGYYCSKLKSGNKGDNQSDEEQNIPGFFITECDVENSDSESDSSGNSQPMSDKDNQVSYARRKLTNAIEEFCVAEVDFNIEDKGYSESWNTPYGNNSEGKQNSKTGGFCIDEVTFNVQKKETVLEPSKFFVPDMDAGSTKDAIPMALVTGPCIADSSFDNEIPECISESTDYLEPIELHFKTHFVRSTVPEAETYEKLQIPTDTKICITDSNGRNEQLAQGNEISFRTCFADLN
jgi:hypothetical protein